MPLKTILNELMSRIPGASGAIFADWEGESVEHVARQDSYELKVIGAHHGIILQNLRRATQTMGGDAVEDVVIGAERLNTVIVPVDSDYFLVLTLSKEQLLGPARRAARECAAKLRQEIS